MALKDEPGELLLVADNTYAIEAVQALQRCNSNVALVHTVRRIWRAVATFRVVDAAHIKGHSEVPWNEFSDVLADFAHVGGTFPEEHGILPQWYSALDELRQAPNLALPCVALPILLPQCRFMKPLEVPRRRKNAAQRRRFASFNALTVSPGDARRGGGLMAPARQAQLAKACLGAGFDAIGLHECRLPGSNTCTVGKYTTVYSSNIAGQNGCGFWVRSGLADHRHLAAIHLDHSRLLAIVRAPTLSMNAFLAHSPIEGSEESETWWAELLRVAKMAPPTGCNLYFIDANGRVGSVPGECVESIHLEAETLNGYLIHCWMRQLGISALSTFRCKGPGATWRSTQNTFRRIDCVCAPRWLMCYPFDTWTARDLDVSTKKDGNFPTVVELLLQPLPPCGPASWHSPLLLVHL